MIYAVKMLEAKKSYWYLQIVSKFLSNDAHNSWERTLCKLSHINVLGSIIYKVYNENYWWLEISRNFCCCFLLSIFSKLQSALGLSFFIASDYSITILSCRINGSLAFKLVLFKVVHLKSYGVWNLNGWSRTSIPFDIQL